MNRVLHALAGVVLLAAAVGALSLDSSTNQLSLVSDRTSGELTLWFENQASTSGEYAVFVHSGELSARVSPAYGVIGPRSSQALILQVSSPSCSVGTFYITINVQLTSGTSVQRASKVVAVNVKRGTECTTEIVGEATNDNFDSASSVQLSSVSLAADFDPSEVNLVVTSDSGITDVGHGEFKQLSLSIYNRGVAGTYELALLNPTPELNAQLSVSQLTLSRNEVENVILDVRPTLPIAGREWVTVQILRNGIVVAQRSVYVDVASTYSAQLVLPRVIRSDNCGEKVIVGTIENTGSAVDSFSVSAVNLGLSTQSVSVPARSSVPFVVKADTSTLPPGNWKLDFELRGRSTSKTSVEFELAQCPSNLLSYSVTVVNPTNSTWKGVTATVENLPQEWSIDSEFPVDIEAGQNHTFVVLVRQKGEFYKEVMPVMVVRDAEGRVLQTENLQPIKPVAPSLTGFFTLGNFGLSDLQLIAVLVFVALVIAVLSARASVARYESL